MVTNNFSTKQNQSRYWFWFNWQIKLTYGIDSGSCLTILFSKELTQLVLLLLPIALWKEVNYSVNCMGLLMAKNSRYWSLCLRLAQWWFWFLTVIWKLQYIYIKLCENCVQMCQCLKWLKFCQMSRKGCCAYAFVSFCTELIIQSKITGTQQWEEKWKVQVMITTEKSDTMW